MKTAFRFLLIISIMVLPFLIQPALAIYFEYDPDDPGEHAPIKEGEKAVIPLDTKDPAYNLWQTTREGLTEGREPGPINIQRYPGKPCIDLFLEHTEGAQGRGIENTHVVNVLAPYLVGIQLPVLGVNNVDLNADTDQLFGQSIRQTYRLIGQRCGAVQGEAQTSAVSRFFEQLPGLVRIIMDGR